MLLHDEGTARAVRFSALSVSVWGFDGETKTGRWPFWLGKLRHQAKVSNAGVCRVNADGLT